MEKQGKSNDKVMIRDMTGDMIRDMISRKIRYLRRTHLEELFNCNRSFLNTYILLPEIRKKMGFADSQSYRKTPIFIGLPKNILLAELSLTLDELRELYAIVKRLG